MIPVNGILIPLGSEDIAGAGTATVPAGTTHFAFGPSTKTNTHVHVLVGGTECIFPSGVPIRLWGRGINPVIAKTADSTFFTDITYFKIEQVV